MYRIVFFEAERGAKPVEEFIDGLDTRTQAKVVSYLTLLQELGPNLKRPYADIVDGKIREIRPRQARIFYFFMFRDRIILVHGFLKKKDRIDPKEIEVANKRMADWIRRYKE